MNSLAPIARATRTGFNETGVHRTPSKMNRRLLYRSVWLPTLITAVLLLIALALLVATSWRSVERLQPVHAHLTQLSRLQNTSLRLQGLLLRSLSHHRPIDPARLDELRDELDDVIASGNHLLADTPARLQRARAALADTATDPRSALITTLGELRQVIPAEIGAHDHLLRTIDHDTRVELEIAIILMIAFPALIAVTMFLLRNRILLPLDNLGTLMTLLGRQDYRAAATHNVDPLLRPLFENYNELIGRLSALERQHQERQHTLEQEVRSATQALLEQQRTLARAERLAAVGELAAGVAHELRNPLAGIQMALANLRRDLSDSDQVQRVDLIVEELKRLTRLLNDLLDQARQAPEPPTELQVAEMVRDFLSLARYQVEENIRLQAVIAEELRCALPEARLRQALLNLVLNAAQAIGDQGGTITIDARMETGALRLSVCDDGPGFPAALLQDGIRSFATWRDNGTGLGLTMVRRLARDLGGEFQLANREPHGACATLSLPCKESHG